MKKLQVLSLVLSFLLPTLVQANPGRGAFLATAPSYCGTHYHASYGMAFAIAPTYYVAPVAPAAFAVPAIYQIPVVTGLSTATSYQTTPAVQAVPTLQAAAPQTYATTPCVCAPAPQAVAPQTYATPSPVAYSAPAPVAYSATYAATTYATAPATYASYATMPTLAVASTYATTPVVAYATPLLYDRVNYHHHHLGATLGTGVSFRDVAPAPASTTVRVGRGLFRPPVTVQFRN